jgi:hypothetical protein
MNYTNNGAVKMEERFKIGSRRNMKYGKINHIKRNCQIVALARKYGISAAAMLWRLYHLRFLSSDSVKATLDDGEFKDLDRSTYGKALEVTPSFSNRFLRLAYLAFETGKVSKSRLARILGVNVLRPRPSEDLGHRSSLVIHTCFKLLEVWLCRFLLNR